MTAKIITYHDRDELLEIFTERAEVLLDICRVVSALLSKIVPAKLVVAHSHRVKDFDSFFSKANKVKNGKLKYADPFGQIEDLIGFRIIVVARRNVDDVCGKLKSALDVQSEVNKSEELLRKGILGYESHHLIVTLGDRRLGLDEYEGLCDTKFEIQVRTALQHAWAENEHRVQYRSTKKDPELNKRFLRLAGIISSADEEFDRIYEINENLTESIKSAVSDLEDKTEASEHDAGLKTIALMFGIPAVELVKRGRFADAITVYDGFIHRQPKQPTHYAGRARAKALAGDIDGALDDLEVADQLAPNHPSVQNVLNILDSLITKFDEE